LTAALADSGDSVGPLDTLASGRHAYWKFDDGTGINASDSSGGDQPGVLNNMEEADWDATTKAPVTFTNSHALSFDGTTSEYVSVSDTTDPSAYTISAWVRPTDVTSVNIIARTNASGPTSNLSHQLRITSGSKFEHYLYAGGGNTVTGTTTVVSGTWYHVAGVVSSNGAMRLYVNGVEEGTPVTIGTLDTSGDRWYIGSNSASSMDYFTGHIDEIRMYDRVLTIDEIADLASGKDTNPISSLAVNGTFTHSSGTFVAPTGTMTIAGNLTRTGGTFTHNNGTVAIAGSGTSTISGSATFYNFTSTAAGKTIQFDDNDTQTFTMAVDGEFKLVGTSGNRINLYSDNATNQFTLNKQGNVDIEYVNVKDAGCHGTSQDIEVDVTTVADQGNNGTCWKFVTPVQVSGTAYENESSTKLTACDGSTAMIKLRVAGGRERSVSCSGVNGTFTLASVLPPVASRPFVLFIDGVGSTFGSTITRYAGSGNLTGLELRRNVVLLTHEDAGPITNADLDKWDNGNDTDLNYVVTGSDLTVETGSKLLVASGKTFTPGGAVTTPALRLDGTYTAGSTTLTLTAGGTNATCTTAVGTMMPLCVNGGTFTTGSSTVNYTGTAATTLSNAFTYNHLGVGTTADSSAATFTLGGDTTVGGVLTVGNSSSTATDTLAGSTATLTFTGNGTPFVLTGNGTFSAGNSTVSYEHATSANMTAATYYNLQTNPASGTPTYTLPAAGPAWWNSSWSKRQPITIDNTGNASTLTNYQVKVDVTYDADMQADFDDLRFTNAAGTVLDYWLEKKTDSTSATIWVEVDSIPASSTATVYLYYGNAGAASASNMSNTFVFGDEFPGSSVDTGKWTITDATGWSVTGGELKGTNTTGRLTSVPTFSDGNILEIKSRRITTSSAGGYQIGGFFVSTSDAFGLLDHPTVAYYRNNTAWTALTGTILSSTNLLTKIAVKSSTLVDLSVTNYDTAASYQSVLNVSNTVATEPVVLGRRYDNGNTGEAYEAYWDWILVRTYTTPEPTPSVGGEQRPFAITNDFTLAGGGNGTVDMNTNDPVLDIDRNLVIGSGQVFQASNSAALTIGGNFTNNGGSGGFVHNGATVTMDAGATGKTFTSGGATFSNLTFDNAAGGWTLQDNLTVASVLTINAGNLDGGTATITLPGSGAPFVVTGTFTPNASTVNYTNTTSATIATTTYYNLQATPASGTPTYTISGPWYGAYSYRKALTIQETQIPGSTALTNFPVLINRTTDTDLAARALDSGNDVAFFDGAGTQLDHEIEKFDGATGELVAWVRIPSLSATANTTIYLAYGKADDSQLHYNATSVWESSYKGVWHGQSDLSESTANGVNLTNSGSTDAAGQLARARSFNGSSQAVSSTTMPMTVTDNFTMSVWVNLSSTTGERVIVSNGFDDGVSSGNGYALEIESGNWKALYSGSVRFNTGTAASTGWKHLTLRRSSGTSQVYLNGSPIGSTFGNAPLTPTTVFAFGAQGQNSTPTFQRYVEGTVDEVRVSSTPRSADWITTEYNNQGTPASFYTTGSEQSNSGVGTLAVSNAFTLGGAGNVTVTAETYDPVVSFSGTMAVGSGDIFITSSTASATLNAAVTNNGTFTHGGAGALNFAGGLTNGSTGVVNYTATNITFERVADVSQGTFPSGKNITLADTDANDDTTLTCGSVTFNSATITKDSGGALTVSSGCTLPLGAAPTSAVSDALVNNGTITVASGTWTVNGDGTLTNNSTLNLGSGWVSEGGFVNGASGIVNYTGTGATFHHDVDISQGTFPSDLDVTLGANGDGDNSTVLCGSKTIKKLRIDKLSAGRIAAFGGDCTVTGDLEFISGDVANPAGALSLTVYGNVILDSSGTFGGGNLTLIMGSTTVKQLTKSAGTYSSKFEVNKTDAGVASLGTVFTTTGQTCTVAGGVFDLSGYNFTCGSTFTVANGGTLRLIGSEASVTVPTLSSGSSVAYKGNGDTNANSYTLKNWTYHHLTAAMTDANDTLDATGVTPLTLGGGLTISSGTFSAPAALNIAGNYNKTGGAFTHNAGTVTFNGSGVQSVTSGGTIFSTVASTNASASGLTFADALTTSNLTDTTAASKLYFAANTTHTVSGTLTLTGTAGNLIVLDRSGGTGLDRFTIDVSGGPQTVSYVDVSNSNASSNDITANTGSASTGGNTDAVEGNPRWNIPGISGGRIPRPSGTGGAPMIY
jgi:hypothetical protein